MSSNSVQGLPLSLALPPEVVPKSKANASESGGMAALFEEIVVTDYEGDDPPSVDPGFEVGLSTITEKVVELPGPGFELVLGGKSASAITIVIQSDFDQETFQLTLKGGIRLRFPTDWLKPVKRNRTEDGEEWVEDESKDHCDIELSAGVTIDQDWNVSFAAKNEFSIGPAKIADSDFVIEGKVALDLSENDTIQASQNLSLPGGQSISDSWQGAVFTDTKLHFPESMNVPIANIGLKNFHIGSGGVTGTVFLKGSMPAPDSAQAKELFGIPYRITRIDIQFVQTAFASASIEAEMQLPFFEDTVALDLGVTMDGDVTATLSSTQGALQTVDKEYFTLKLERIGFELEDDVPAVLLGGVIDPKTNKMDADLTMPGVDVEELRVDAEGNVDIEGGWLELGDQYQAKVAGFGLEITKFGFGKTDDGGKWIGFSGGIDLLKGISAGASVKGLRFEWGGNRQGMEVTLEGVGLEFEIPGTLKFKGEVSWEGQAFRGAIDLELVALDMTIDAEVVFGTVTKNGSEFKYMGVFIDADLPAGIPLWATGLSLYGFSGLFASQMEPDKTDQEKWYSVEESESWYHNPDQPGVVPLGEQWEPTEGSMGFGAGTTVASAPDNGLSVATDVLVAIAFPGPVIMIQGRADIMKPGADVPSDAPFQALAVIDSRAGSFTLGIDAKYKEGDQGQLLDIAASVEAFFSFSDPNAWYLNIGKKKPRDARVQASALSIFTAEAYFMLNPSRVATGIWYGYDKSWSFGPLSVSLEAWIESDVVVNFEPAHFTGSVHLHGEAALKAFGVGLGLTVDAKLGAEVFDPFHVKGSFEASVSTPWPLPDPSATVSLEWGPTKDPPALPEVIESTGVGHKKLASTWGPTEALDASEANALNALSIPGKSPASDAPVVPQDARPEVTFARAVHDESGTTKNPHAPNPAREVIGDPAKKEGPVEVRYALARLRLLQYDGRGWSAVDEVDGTWAPMPSQPKHGQGTQGTNPDLDQTKLQLFTRTPFAYSRHTGGAWEDALSRTHPHYPCPIKTHCYDFNGLTLQDDFTRERTYTYEPDTTSFTYEKTGPDPWPGFVFASDGDVASPELYSVKIASPTRVPGSALVIEETDKLPSSPKGYPYEFYISLPHAPRSVRLTFHAPKYRIEGEVVITDDQQLRTTSWSAQGGTEEVIVTASGDSTVDFLTVRFRFPSEMREVRGEVGNPIEGHRRLALLGICGSQADFEKLPAETNYPPESKVQIEQAQDRLEAYSERGRVLEPDTDYRLEVVTKTDAQGQGDFQYSETTYRARYFDFHTAGPPGLETPDTPGGGQSGSGQAGKQSSGLESLNRYVEQTTPETVPAEGERPPLPRPVYRTDPIGTNFNEDYVDLQYRLARRDLTVHLYDDNDRPVRDARGRLVIVKDAWEATPELLLDRATARWFATVAESSCLDLDGRTIEHTKRLERAAEERVLVPDAVHEARLKPLLFRDGFDRGTGAWSTAGGNWGLDDHDGFEGKNGSLQGSTLTVRGGIAGQLRAHLDTVTIKMDSGTESFGIDSLDPANNEITLNRTPPSQMSGSIEWSIPARSVAVQTASASGGARWRLTSNPAFDDGVSPSKWTDYRVAATLRIRRGGSGIVGLTVRDSGNTHYRIELDTSGTRRIVRVEGGTDTKTWSKSDDCQPGRDYRVAVEAIGDELQVLVDGEPIVSVTDTDGPDSGTVALYARDNPDAQFDDVRIDDFRSSAPVAYQFAFTTSLFADARHHLHSYNDGVWAGTYPNSKMNQVSTVQLDDSTSEDEFRDFRSVATELPNDEVDRLEVTRLDDGDTPKGLFVNSPEPIEWETTDIDVERGPRFERESKPEPPTALKLTDASPGDSDVTALLRESIDLTGYDIEYRRPGAGFVPNLVNDHAILTDNLTQVGGGQWEIEEGARGQAGSLSALLDETGDATVLVADVTRIDGEAGMIFRYTGSASYYQLTGDGDKLRLTRSNGGTSVLWEGPGILTAEESRTLRIELANGRIRGAVDGVPTFDVADPETGGLGRAGATLDDGVAEFGRLRIAEGTVRTPLDRRDFSNGGLGDWRIVDEPPYSTRESDWKVQGGRLRQTSNIYGFVGGDVNAPGTYAVTGEDWEDYRLTARLSSGDNDAIGLMFRYQDDGNCYRFSMDNERSYRRLIRRVDGEPRLLWSDEQTGFESNREYMLTVECVGERLRGYLDGELLFDVTDGAHASGQVGCYTRANENANFFHLRVFAPAETWQRYHTFRDEVPMPAGTRISIADSAPSWTDEPRTEHRQPSSGDALPPDSVYLRIRTADDEVGHLRQFTDANYQSTGLDALRSADGTGLLLVDSTGLESGAYRLTFSPGGQNNPLDNSVQLDVPWSPRGG